ncbi:MAG: riboflavin synthase [Pseudomonadota bacterium]
MFTGIVADVGRVAAIEDRERGRRLTIETPLADDSLDWGASVACSGGCLTAVAIGPGWFAVDAAAETMDVTTVGAWAVGAAINLERALKVGDELGGHFVFGHVDGLGALTRRAQDGEGVRMAFSAPESLRPLLAPKGSIAIDGVSLTVNGVSDDGFDVLIVPHTLSATTLGAMSEGTTINLEADMLARYVARAAAFGAG